MEYCLLKTRFRYLLFMSFYFSTSVSNLYPVYLPRGCDWEEQQHLMICNNISTLDHFKLFRSEFNNTEKLEIINMSFDYIPSEIFSYFANLRHLKITQGRLKYIADDTFQRLSNLKGLNLSYNQIERIDTGGFHGLFNIREISLEHNRLYKINPNCLTDLQSLKRLTIHHNQLSTIENLLSTLNESVILDLRYNNIRKADLNLFGYRNVSTLNATRISFRKGTASRTIQEIRLDHNPVICDCNLLAIVVGMKDFVQINGTCTYPLDNVELDISNVNNSKQCLYGGRCQGLVQSNNQDGSENASQMYSLRNQSWSKLLQTYFTSIVDGSFKGLLTFACDCPPAYSGNYCQHKPIKTQSPEAAAHGTGGWVIIFLIVLALLLNKAKRVRPKKTKKRESMEQVYTNKKVLL